MTNANSVILKQKLYVTFFHSAKKLKNYGKNVKNWIFIRTGINVTFTETMKILGYTKYDENFWPVNSILMKLRHYIYHCSKTKQPLNIFQLQKKLKINMKKKNY